MKITIEWFSLERIYSMDDSSYQNIRPIFSKCIENNSYMEKQLAHFLTICDSIQQKKILPEAANRQIGNGPTFSGIIYLKENSEEKKPIGMIGIVKLTVNSITLFKEYQGKGIGTKVVLKIKDIYDKYHARFIITTVLELESWMKKLHMIKREDLNHDGSQDWVSDKYFSLIEMKRTTIEKGKMEMIRNFSPSLYKEILEVDKITLIIDKAIEELGWVDFPYLLEIE